MANFNNLIRPPVLNLETESEAINRTEPNAPNLIQQHRQVARQETHQQNRNIMAQPEQLAEIVRQILAEQLPTLLHQSQSSSFDFANVESQGINPEHQHNLQDLDKVPDIVRSLHDF
jgi:hypothetical protein